MIVWKMAEQLMWEKENFFSTLETSICAQKVDTLITSVDLFIKVAFLHSFSGQTYFELLHELAINKAAFLKHWTYDFIISGPPSHS